MNLRPEVRVDWCSTEAARYAVLHWHYSRKMPVGKLIKLGVWEGGQFIGSIIYGLGGGGACNGQRYGLRRNFDMAEVQRIALRTHQAPVSQLLMRSVRLVHRHCPGLRLLISYADPTYGHHGGIYQAANWIYTGQSASDWKAVWSDGREAHSRIARRHTQFGVKKVVDISGSRRVAVVGKHRYVYPLDAEIRARILPLARPYPKRPTSIGSDASAVQVEECGAIPTVGLLIEDTE